jgi:GNAT superfamily N-acetyltransferase
MPLPPGITIRPAAPTDLPLLAAIDDDACRLYDEAGLTVSLAADHPFLQAEQARWLGAAQRARAFLAIDASGEGVGFAALGEADGLPYLEQLSVRRGAMRRGIGRALLRLAVDEVRRQAGRAIWLTTWNHLPYNRPFYEREGFALVPEPQCGADLLRHLAEQRRWLPAPDQRVAMRRLL